MGRLGLRFRCLSLLSCKPLPSDPKDDREPWDHTIDEPVERVLSSWLLSKDVLELALRAEKDALLESCARPPESAGDTSGSALLATASAMACMGAGSFSGGECCQRSKGLSYEECQSSVVGPRCSFHLHRTKVWHRRGRVSQERLIVPRLGRKTV